jgi:hypothetical protein
VHGALQHRIAVDKFVTVSYPWTCAGLGRNGAPLSKAGRFVWLGGSGMTVALHLANDFRDALDPRFCSGNTLSIS